MIERTAHRGTGARVALTAVLIVSACLGSAATAQTRPSADTSTTETSAYTGKGLRRDLKPGGGNVTADANATTAPAAGTSSGLDATRVLLSLGVVLVLIFGLRFFGQKWFVPGAAKSSSRTVETLSRSTIGPKQQVILIRVGRRRLLVVGDSGGKLEPLDQITDPDEVAELVTQVRTEKLGPAANAFGSLFGKSAATFEATKTGRSDGTKAAPQARDDYENDEEVAEPNVVDLSTTTTRRDLEDLLAKVRGASSRLG